MKQKIRLKLRQKLRVEREGKWGLKSCSVADCITVFLTSEASRPR